MKEAFIEKKFKPESMVMIGRVNGILDEYRRQGFRLSLRQLYYQLVARDVIANNIRSYKNLGSLVSDARQAGYVDWDMIEDRNRETSSNSHWSNPGEIVKVAARQFAIDKWADQPYHVEVMVEKDALSGVLQPVCRTLDISITANKGYSSSSTMYEIGKRLQAEHYDDKQVLILYLGDHDPSGIDMTRDVEDRLRLFSGLDDDYQLQVQRIALNIDQVRTWNPPENPAKQTDARFDQYVRRFGESSWELDAVEPRTLADLVSNAVLAVRDDDLWDAAVEKERLMKAELQRFADSYQSES